MQCLLQSITCFRIRKLLFTTAHDYITAKTNVFIIIVYYGPFSEQIVKPDIELKKSKSLNESYAYTPAGSLLRCKIYAQNALFNVFILIRGKSWCVALYTQRTHVEWRFKQITGTEQTTVSYAFRRSALFSFFSYFIMHAYWFFFFPANKIIRDLYASVRAQITSK